MTQEILVQEKQVKESIKDLPAMVTEITSVQVKSQDDYSRAFDLTKQVKTKSKELDELRKSLTKPLDETKKRIMDMFRHPQENLAKAEKHLKGVMIDYTDEQERIRAEAERKLREQAEKEAEKEREKLRKKAEKATEKGKTELAEELNSQVEEVAPVNVILSDTAPTPQGGSFRMNYYADEKIDMTLLSDAYKLPNMKAINAFVKATKGQVPIPGVKIMSERIMSVRG